VIIYIQVHNAKTMRRYPMPEEMRGFCPICHTFHEVIDYAPQDPDDPCLDSTDFFRMGDHPTPSGDGICPGSGKEPNGFEDLGDEDLYEEVMDDMDLFKDGDYPDPDRIW
jgi:hypothetical protein